MDIFSVLYTFLIFTGSVNYRIMKEANIKKNTAALLNSCQILPQMYLQFSFESNGPIIL